MNNKKINKNISYFKKENLSWPNNHCSEFHSDLINKSWNGNSLFLEKNISDDHKSNSVPLQIRDFQWDVDSASHLLKRTIVGSTMQDINELIDIGFENSIEYILLDEELPSPPYVWVNEDIPDWNSLSSEERQSIIQSYHNRMRVLQRWWAQRMINGTSNLTEVMTLFWHSYFASAYSKVFYPQAMYQQNNVFRTYCMGNFKELLRNVTFGPAMMIWLDISGSRKEAPNENFARELMELFTLGIDNYTQNDVIAASRAFTGYVTNGLDTNYDFDSMEGWGYWWTDWHDFEEKTFLNQTGPWNGDDIINIILEQNECAIHICKKIYKWFLYDNPNMEFVNSMADILRSSDYEIKPALEYLFSSEHFYNNEFVGSNIQNPVQLYLGSIRRLKMENQPFDNDYFSEIQNHLSMILFEPPDVNGWVGYRSWINSNTLPSRKAMLCALVDHESPFGTFGNYINIPAVAQSLVNVNDNEYHIIQIINNLALLFLGLEINENLNNQLLNIALDGAEPYDWDINLPAHNAQWNRFEDLLRHIIRLPEFQLS